MGSLHARGFPRVHLSPDRRRVVAQRPVLNLRGSRRCSARPAALLLAATAVAVGRARLRRRPVGLDQHRVRRPPHRCDEMGVFRRRRPVALPGLPPARPGSGVARRLHRRVDPAHPPVSVRGVRAGDAGRRRHRELHRRVFPRGGVLDRPLHDSLSGRADTLAVRRRRAAAGAVVPRRHRARQLPHDDGGHPAACDDVGRRNPAPLDTSSPAAAERELHPRRGGRSTRAHRRLHAGPLSGYSCRLGIERRTRQAGGRFQRRGARAVLRSDLYLGSVPLELVGRLPAATGARLRTGGVGGAVPGLRPQHLRLLSLRVRDRWAVRPAGVLRYPDRGRRTGRPAVPRHQAGSGDGELSCAQPRDDAAVADRGPDLAGDPLRDELGGRRRCSRERAR